MAGVPICPGLPDEASAVSDSAVSTFQVDGDVRVDPVSASPCSLAAGSPKQDAASAMQEVLPSL